MIGNKSKTGIPQTNPKSLANLKNGVRFQKGQIAWNKGVPQTHAVKDVISKANKGKRMSIKTEFKKGEHKSIATEFKKGNGRRGELHPNWKGGITGKFLLEKREKIIGRKKPEQCELCGSIGRICFDHDHKTGKFRGWICLRCNMTLGFVKDNKELLFMMINYLKNNE